MDKELKKQVLSDIKTTVEQAKGTTEVLREKDNWSSPAKWLANTELISGLLSKVIVTVEKVANSGEEMSLDEKVDYAVAVLDDLIPAPGLLELVDGMIIRMLVNFVVDKLNTRFGHLWNDANVNEVLDEDLVAP